MNVFEHFLNYPTLQEALKVADNLNNLADQGNSFMNCSSYIYAAGEPMSVGRATRNSEWAGLYRKKRAGVK